MLVEITIAPKITTTTHVTENTAMFISEYSTEKPDVGAEFAPSAIQGLVISSWTATPCRAP